MTQPENFTAAQASDPQTPGQVLADIAALRPDLRAAVASNPSTYPGLLDWLKSLGDPAVDAAIAARPAAGQVTQQMPVQPPLAPQGGQVPPAPAWAGQANQGAPAYYGTPQGMPQQGMPQGMPPQGMPPQGMPMGGYAGAPAPRKSNKTALWVILGIVVLIILLGVGAVIFFINRAKDVVDDVVDDIDITDITGDGDSYGDDAALDALWDACENEDWEACDSLFMQAPVGSEYEDFGDTCGNRTDGSSFCTTEFGGGTATDTPTTYGDDAALDALWDACSAEDWESCDALYMAAAVGSEYESYGDTCGGRTDGTAYCVEEMGGGTTTTTEPFTYGDDAALDALWDACTGEDWQACDDLYLQSAVGSDYELYGDTCGNKYEAGTTNFCTEVMP